MLLQALVKLKDFDENPIWVLNNLVVPGLNTADITKGLQRLLELGCLERDPNGRLQAAPTSTWRPDPFVPDGQRVYTTAAESIAYLMQTPKKYRPSVYSSMALALDEKNLIAAEKYMIEVHHHLCKLSNESQSPSALVQIGNFLLTVARLESSK